MSALRSHLTHYLLPAVLLMALGACQPAMAIIPTPAATDTAVPVATAVPTETRVPTQAPVETPTSPVSGGYPLPDACVKVGQPLYVDRQAGLCFAIPLGFAVERTEQGFGRVYGPAVGSAPEKLSAGLTVETRPANGLDLHALTTDYLAAFADLPVEIARREKTLGGEPAVLLEPVPGRLSARVALVRHVDTLYVLTFWPTYSDVAADQLSDEMRRVQGDADALLAITTASLAFLPGTDVGALALPATCLVDGQAVYVDAAGHYCYSVPLRFSVEQSESSHPILWGPALDDSADPLRATLSLEASTTVEGITLEDQVGAFAAQLSAEEFAALQQTEESLGGEPAIVLHGVRSRGGSKDLFVLHELTLYHLIFWPDVASFPQAAPDVETLYDAMMATFTFLSGPAPSADLFDGVVAGRVFWDTEPVAGASVALRVAGEPTDPQALIAEATTDEQGRFRVEQMPAGEYEVFAAWPDGARLGVGTPVTLAAGDKLLDVRVELVKEQVLLEPVGGARTSLQPTLRWLDFPGAIQYHVLIFDAESGAGVYDAFVEDTSLTLPEPLPAGQSYHWVVNTLTQSMGLLAVGDGDFQVAP